MSLFLGAQLVGAVCNLPGLKACFFGKASNLLLSSTWSLSIWITVNPELRFLTTDTVTFSFKLTGKSIYIRHQGKFFFLLPPQSFFFFLIHPRSVILWWPLPCMQVSNLTLHLFSSQTWLTVSRTPTLSDPASQLLGISNFPQETCWCQYYLLLWINISPSFLASHPSSPLGPSPYVYTILSRT